MLTLLLLATLVGSSTAQIERISSGQLFGREWLGLKIDAIIDVRTAEEFATGHVPGAMLVDSLASFGTDPQADGPQALAGCEYCDIAAYCSSGNRAAAALRILQQAGFQGRLYNAGTITQWRENNYPISQGASRAQPCTTNPTVGQQCLADFNARSPTTTTTTTQGTTPTTGFPQQQQTNPNVVQVGFFDWNNADSWNTPVFEASGTEDAGGATGPSFPATPAVPEPFTPTNNFAANRAEPATNPAAPARPVPVVQWGTAQWTDPEEEFPDLAGVRSPAAEEVPATSGTGTDTTTGGSNTNPFGPTIEWNFGGSTQLGQQREEPAANPIVPGPSPGSGNFVDRWSGNTWVINRGGGGTGAGAGGSEATFEASSNGASSQGSFPGFSFVNQNAPGPAPVPNTSASAAGATDPVSGSSFTDWFSAFSGTSSTEEAENDNTPTGFATPVRGGTNTWNTAAAAETTQVEDTWGNGKVVWLDALESGTGTSVYRNALVLAAPLLVLLL